MKLPTPKTLLSTTLAGAALVCAGTALATVTVYDNPINSGNQMRELKQVTGGSSKCRRDFSTNRKVMRVKVRGRRLCGYRPPVEGDSNGPDLQLRLVGTILKGTSKRARKAGYLAVGVRSAGVRGYTLEVRPRTRRFTLSRGPDSGAFPVGGRSNKIKGVGQRNVISLRAFGNVVIATANGSRLAKVTDPGGNHVDGRRTTFGVGSNKDLNPGPIGRIERVTVTIPNP